MDSYGFLWIPMDSYGFLWNSYGFLWTCNFSSQRSCPVHTDLTGWLRKHTKSVYTTLAWLCLLATPMMDGTCYVYSWNEPLVGFEKHVYFNMCFSLSFGHVYTESWIAKHARCRQQPTKGKHEFDRNHLKPKTYTHLHQTYKTLVYCACLKDVGYVAKSADCVINMKVQTAIASCIIFQPNCAKTYIIIMLHQDLCPSPTAPMPCHARDCHAMPHSRLYTQQRPCHARDSAQVPMVCSRFCAYSFRPYSYQDRGNSATQWVRWLLSLTVVDGCSPHCDSARLQAAIKLGVLSVWIPINSYGFLRNPMESYVC
jgi:hypothetical protein